MSAKHFVPADVQTHRAAALADHNAKERRTIALTEAALAAAATIILAAGITLLAAGNS